MLFTLNSIHYLGQIKINIQCSTYSQKDNSILEDVCQGRLGKEKDRTSRLNSERHLIRFDPYKERFSSIQFNLTNP